MKGTTQNHAARPSPMWIGFFRSSFLVLAILAFCPATFGEENAAAETVMTPVAAAAAVGQDVRMVGRVEEVVITEEGTLYLNFGGKFPNEVLTVVILKPLKEKFPEAEKWSGEKVLVRGRVTLKNEKHPRILVRDPADLSLLPPDPKP